MTSSTLQQCLSAAKQRLAGVLPMQEASQEARILCMAALGVTHAWLLTHGDKPLTTAQQAQCEALVERRLQGEPVAHILGQREFFGLSLQVTPDTLIPRPDTETLVEAALARMHPPDRPPLLRILDLGTGTGAIALALASHGHACQVTAVDASAAALAVAASNARALGLDNVQCVLSDWFSALEGQRFDLIVSNPPYIAENDPHLQQGDVRFEPQSALVSGVDGLDDLRHLIEQAPRFLNPSGWLLLEHGYNQAAAVQALCAAQGFKQIQTLFDLGQQPRVTLGQWLPPHPV